MAGPGVSYHGRKSPSVSWRAGGFIIYEGKILMSALTLWRNTTLATLSANDWGVIEGGINQPWRHYCLAWQGHADPLAN